MRRRSSSDPGFPSSWAISPLIKGILAHNDSRSPFGGLLWYGDEKQRAFVAGAWLFKREPVRAAREIPAAAESMSPRQRCVAVELADRFGDDGRRAWREARSAPRVGPHAQVWLARWDQGPKPGVADRRWLAVEAAAAALDDMGADEVFSRYDFGADWEHEIRLEKTVSRDHSQQYPVCVAFNGDSPVEYWEERKREKPAPFVLKNVNRRLAALGHAR